MYATFEYYKTEYHGSKITEEEWPSYGMRASDFLDYATRRKLENNLPENEGDLTRVKKACCAVAEAIKEIDGATQNAGQTGAGAVRSISSGGESISYGNTALSLALEQGEAGTNKYLLGKAKQYLSMVADKTGDMYLYWGIT